VSEAIFRKLKKREKMMISEKMKKIYSNEEAMKKL
jgi:hypothetical protein